MEKQNELTLEQICWKVSAAFDYDHDVNPFAWGFDKESPPPGLMSLLYKSIVETMVEDRRKWSCQELTDDEKNKIDELAYSAYQIPLAFGYVLGQMYDIPCQDVQESVDAIKQVIREKGLLPYLPRERRATT